MSKVQHENQTPPPVAPLLNTPTKQLREGNRKPRPPKKRKNNRYGVKKKTGTVNKVHLKARMERDAATCDCGKLKQNPKNNACVECWLRKKPDTPPKKKRKAQTLTEQTLNDEEKAILDKLRDPKTIGRYELVYKPTQKRTIDQCYNKVAEMESIVQEQRVKEVRLLNEMHQAQLTSQSSLATKKRNGKS